MPKNIMEIKARKEKLDSVKKNHKKIILDIFSIGFSFIYEKNEQKDCRWAFVLEAFYFKIY